MKTLFKHLLFATLLLPFGLRAQNPIADAIKQNSGKLRYPHSVERFYQQEGYSLIWVLKDTVKTPAWDAMILLDGVLQYGLNPVDYHQKELTYNKLHLAQIQTVNDPEKAYFDLIMTDAIITLINNLHYGKLNPDFPVKRIDADNITEFKGDKILIDALQINNLMTAILNVQPHFEAYMNLQRHMKLLTTKYSGSNYVKPESDIRNMAISMDRLRWVNTTGKQVHLTCIVKDGVIIYSK
jgi:hypothetical protein